MRTHLRRLVSSLQVKRIFSRGVMCGVVTAICLSLLFPVADACNSVPPKIISPNNCEVTTLSPTLVIDFSTQENAESFVYIYEVSTDSTFRRNVISDRVKDTRWVVTPALHDKTRYYWRVSTSHGHSPIIYSVSTTATFFVNTVNTAPSVPGISFPKNNSLVTTLQPRLSITNANDPDIYDTLSYDFNVALDSSFVNMVASKTGIAQGSGGTTSWTVTPGLTEDTQYYWRVRSIDSHGATSDWVNASFTVSTSNSAPTAPAAIAPIDASEVTSFNPALKVNNATDPEHDSLNYTFEIDTANTFDTANKQTSGAVVEGTGSTIWTPANLLAENTTYYWRAKANDGHSDGPYSATSSFFVNTVNEDPSIPVVISPVDRSPDITEVAVLNPTLLVQSTDPDNDSITYKYEVYADSSGLSLVTGTSGEGNSWDVLPALSDNTQYWWRAQATDSHGAASDWTILSTFFVNNEGYDDPPTITITNPVASTPKTSADSFTIMWTAADPDSNPIITLYYDTVGSEYNGTQIVTGIHKDDHLQQYVWDISSLTTGTYFIYGKIDDGTTVVSSYATGPLLIDRTAPPLTTWTIYASAGIGGSMVPPGNSVVTEGNDQSYITTPGSGYKIEDVLVDGVSVLGSPNYSVDGNGNGTYLFSNVIANHNLSVRFTPIAWTITASVSGSNGTITPLGATLVPAGASQAYTITPDPGYRVVDVLVDSASVGPLTGYTFTTVTSNHTIAASFALFDQIAISTQSPLPRGLTGTPYSQSLTASGGGTPYIWSIIGSLPNGLVLDTATGLISGTPITASTTNFTVQVTDNIITATKTFSLTIIDSTLKPDLTISAFSGPSTGGAGKSISITDTTKNNGRGDAPTSATSFYLSKNSSLDATAIRLGSRAVGPIAAGATDQVTTTLTIPVGTAGGTYYLIARADDYNTIAESNEDNNTYFRNITIGTDLTISALSCSSTGGTGKSISITDTTRNNGAGDAPASATGFYLSKNSTLDATAIRLGSRAVGPIAAGATDQGTTAAIIPAGTATGTYYLIAKADDYNTVAELSEDNNTNARSITIGPDLTIFSLSGPSTAGAGKSISITDTTKNVGAGDAPASATGFYLSKNSTLDATAIRLGSRAVGPIAAGATDQVTTTLAIPAGTATGTYYLIAKADDYNTVAEFNKDNNTNAKSITIGPDLTIYSLSGPSTAGAGKSISITDTTKNVGAGDAPASATGFYLSKNSTLDATAIRLGSRAVGPIAAGATDQVTTTVTIPAGTATGTYSIIAKADDYNTVVELNKDNNTNSRSVTIGPDLTIYSLSGPSTAGAGKSISITDTTKNVGAGDAPASTTGFYLSTNSTLDATAVRLGSRAVGPIAAGATDQVTTTVTIPAGTATGTYSIIAKADDNNTVAELSEDNNTNSKSITIGPDLTIFSVSAPSTAGAGKNISITDTTKNNGPGDAPASTTSFYLSKNGTLDATAIRLGSRAIPALVANTTDQVITTVTIPAGTATGTYYLITKADDNNTVPELNEDNNTYSRSITIGPDLTIYSLSGPSTGGAGRSISITDTTKNNGPGDAPASATGFYLSKNSTLDATAVRLGSRAIQALVAGTTDQVTTTVTIPAGTATGAYSIIAKADDYNTVPELNKDNNTYSKSITIGPDLTIYSVSGPSTAGAGKSISITDTTKNVGAGDAPASTTSFYLSKNSTLDATAVRLGSRAVGPIAPGATDQVTTTVTIPAGTATGTYSIIAKADDSNAVAELSEDNNTNSRNITIGPDLTVYSLSGPSTAGAGKSISITDTTKNVGAGDAPASTTNFYFSRNSSFDASAVLIGSRAVPTLAAGTTDQVTTTVTIPAGTATGTYYLIARADDGNIVVELNETNNTYSRSITIGPDLTVYSLSGPSTAGAGKSISITDTTKNLGPGDAPASTTSFYFSRNSSFDASAVLIGSRAVPTLAAGTTDQVTTTVTIPAGTATGTYYLIARADDGNIVVELNETNNTYSRSITIGPDLAIYSLSGPSTAGAGKSISITDTTKNAGAGDASASTTSFYLSRNSSFDASAVLIGSRAVPTLAAGTTDQVTTTVTIPAGTAAGTYYIIARADDGNIVAELNEYNNTYVLGITVGP